MKDFADPAADEAPKARRQPQGIDVGGKIEQFIPGNAGPGRQAADISPMLKLRRRHLHHPYFIFRTTAPTDPVHAGATFAGAFLAGWARCGCGFCLMESVPASEETFPGKQSGRIVAEPFRPVNDNPES